jgi:surfactin family lipopeptide synthetase A/lichenysin synthetase A
VTAGGKVDAAALRELTTPVEEAPVEAPADPVEAVLLGVWRQVLGAEPLGSHTDFFDVGGHSLAMLRIVGRVAELLGVELAVDVFYDAPTVAAHAGLIRAQQGTAVAGRAQQILDQGSEPATWRAA